MDAKKGLFIRTDMADEAHRLWSGRAADKGEIKGVSSSESTVRGLPLCHVKILDQEGEKALNKARGNYFSLSLPEYFDRGSEKFSDAALALSGLILRCAGGSFERVLVACLGNPDISPDALGSLCSKHVLVTAHLEKEKFPQFSSISLCCPGVLGSSGMETASQVRALSRLCSAELVIVVDALAGSDPERLCRCIQVSDAGICPGSGVGNDRQELSTKSLGLPTVSVGMPTVIDAAHLGSENYGGMFVTPRNIDLAVRDGARLIAYGIDLACHRGISIADIDALT